MHQADDSTPDRSEDSRDTGRGIARRRFLRNTGLVAFGAMIPAAGARAAGAFGSPGTAPEPVNLSVDAGARGPVVPSDFTGLSFERGALNSGNAGVPGYFFSPSNTELVTLWRNAGIRNLRVGGNTVDQQIPAGTGSDGFTGVDELFRFAAAAGANVIYSLRQDNSTSHAIPDLVTIDAEAARYIWQRYASLLSSFSIGNEVDWHSYHLHDPAIYETTPGEPGTAYPSYLADWRKFADAVHQAAPGAKLNGPDTGNYGTRGGVPYTTFTPTQATGVSWTQRFAEDEVGTGLISDATTHLYVGGSPFDTTAAQAIANMLSADWVEKSDIGYQPTGSGSGTTAYVPYPWFNTNIVAPTVAVGVPVRLTESNDYLTGIPGASDAFASALWALDYMHYWARRGVSGVNFHNKQWIYTDTITPALGSYSSIPGGCDAPGCGGYRVNPKGYAIKAFDLGARGQVKPITVDKSPNTNVTAYAVGGDNDLYVTVINKMYGAGSASVDVTIEPRDFGFTEAAYMTLQSGQPGDPTSSDATLGGAAITNSTPWVGKWTPLSSPSQGRVAVTVQPASAVVVRIHR